MDAPDVFRAELNAKTIEEAVLSKTIGAIMSCATASKRLNTLRVVPANFRVRFIALSDGSCISTKRDAEDATALF